MRCVALETLLQTAFWIETVFRKLERPLTILQELENLKAAFHFLRVRMSDVFSYPEGRNCCGLYAAFAMVMPRHA